MKYKEKQLVTERNRTQLHTPATVHNRDKLENILRVAVWK